MKLLLLEKIGIGCSIIGSTISLAIGQPSYSTIPITATLGINYINRRQEIRELDEAEIATREKVKKTRNRLEKTRGKVEDIKNLIPPNTHSNTENNLTESRISSLERNFEKIETHLNSNLKTIVDRFENSIKNDYTYELIQGRKESREVLIEALDNAEEEMIIVCPWLGFGFNEPIIERCKQLLNNNVNIKIGWGKNTDINNNSLNKDFNQNSFQLDKLSQINPEKFSYKLLGTHEKFVVCDHKIAMLSSHNFLTSIEKQKERELGIKTNDPRIIHKLIELYYQADNIAISNDS